MDLCAVCVSHIKMLIGNEKKKSANKLIMKVFFSYSQKVRLCGLKI